MTEAEWLACDNHPAMLIHLRGELTPEEQEQHVGLNSRAGRLAPGPAQRTTPARLRAFASACLPRWRELPVDPVTRHVLDVYEAFLSGTASHPDFFQAALRLQDVPPNQPRPWLHSLCSFWDDTPHGVGHMTWNLESQYAGYLARDEIAELERTADPDDLFGFGFFGYDMIPLWMNTVKALDREFVALLHETVGNPFRPVAFSPSWRTEAVVALARTMYESRDFAAMPVLADALDDAGCDHPDLLAHCRGGGPHVRGCWVVDLVLGQA